MWDVLIPEPETPDGACFLKVRNLEITAPWHQD